MNTELIYKELQLNKTDELCKVLSEKNINTLSFVEQNIFKTFLHHAVKNNNNEAVCALIDFGIIPEEKILVERSYQNMNFLIHRKLMYNSTELYVEPYE